MRGINQSHRITRRYWYALVVALLALAAGLLPAGGAAAPAGGPAHLVTEINISTLDSSPTDTIAVGSAIYFSITDALNVSALWRSDGTAAGTTRIADNVERSEYANVNGTLFFSADDGIHGVELWKTDGTLAGTTMVKDIVAGAAGAFPFNLTNVNGSLFFGAGLQLWKSDGTAAGTQPVAPISAVISNFVNANGIVFFVVRGSPWYDLWKSDGTAAGTLQVIKNIPPLQVSATPVKGNNITPSLGDFDISTVELANVNRTVFFAIRNLDSGYRSGLWKSDGTPASTNLVKGIDPTELTAVDTTLFFHANDGMHGEELWKSDGTTAGTTLVRDIFPGSNSSSPTEMTSVNGTLFFAANGGIRGAELWKSDGATAGTVRVADINPDAGSSNPTSLVNVNGTLFFSADDGTHGTELWKSDGTAIGTVLIKDIYPGEGGSIPAWITNANGTLFFSARDRRHGVELWKSAGTVMTTALVKDINAKPANLSPHTLTDVNGTLFFTSDDGKHGIELWRSDGQAADTMLVKDIPLAPNNLGIPGSAEAVNLNGTLFLEVFDGRNGYQLWKSDGTTAGTTLFNFGSPSLNSSSHPFQLTTVNGVLFFTAYFTACSAFRSALWKSDGTAAGTIVVKDILPCDSFVQDLTNVNGTLFFVIGKADYSSELWKSDGTPAGTILVKAFPANPNNSIPAQLTDVNGKLFFVADDGIHGIELWKSDGTPAGTSLVKDFPANPHNAFLGQLTDVNGKLFFIADDRIHGIGLWKSDGTPAGTTLVKEFSPDQIILFDFATVSRMLFFAMVDKTHGSELWKSDGTTVGTVLVKDISPDKGSSPPQELVNVQGTLLFVAMGSGGSRAIWRSDGTTDGTRSVQDIPNDVYTSTYLMFSGSSLFFNSSSGSTGRELWAIPISAGVDIGVTAPDLVGGPAGGMAAIPLAYLNTGLATATAVTLTATLDPHLVYVDDASGITPSVSGATLTWRLPGAGFLDGRDFRVRLSLPSAPLGTRYPVTLRVASAEPDAQLVNNSVQVDVMVADMHYLPAVR